MGLSQNICLKGKPGKCVWTRGIDAPVYLPIAHGEGKFVPRDAAVCSA
jgi:phosphoribosylformylglycinamidine (FGAM) synthase-like amidotransferase family enzyme